MIPVSKILFQKKLKKLVFRIILSKFWPIITSLYAEIAFSAETERSPAGYMTRIQLSRKTKLCQTKAAPS